MPPSPRRRWERLACAALLTLLGLVLLVRGEPHGCLTLEQLGHMSPCQLEEIFTRADLGRPLVGKTYGRLVCVVDARLPRVKKGFSNAVWRGKTAHEGGYFINRWVGGFEAIDSHYVIGPSWLDGRPAILMEYAPGTKLFANTHDEFREVAPGLYLGPLYDRFPCPRLRGYVALQVLPCQEQASRWPCR
jgi:hypothetical protein